MKDREDPCPPIVPTDFNLYYAEGDEFDPEVNDVEHPMFLNGFPSSGRFDSMDSCTDYVCGLRSARQTSNYITKTNTTINSHYLFC